MTILTLGLNHNTAPVSIRERVAFPAERLRSALAELVRLPEVEEAAILSTCNRTEVYCGTGSSDKERIIDWIAHEQRLKREEFHPYLYAHTDAETIRHIFRVACGLDSMILGEPQILGQMKTAYQVAA